MKSKTELLVLLQDLRSDETLTNKQKQPKANFLNRCVTLMQYNPDEASLKSQLQIRNNEMYSIKKQWSEKLEKNPKLTKKNETDFYKLTPLAEVKESIKVLTFILGYNI